MSWVPVAAMRIRQQTVLVSADRALKKIILTMAIAY